MITKSPGQCDKGSLSLSSAATQEKELIVGLWKEHKRGNKGKSRHARRKAAREAKRGEIKVWRAK